MHRFFDDVDAGGAAAGRFIPAFDDDDCDPEATAAGLFIVEEDAAPLAAVVRCTPDDDEAATLAYVSTHVRAHLSPMITGLGRCLNALRKFL